MTRTSFAAWPAASLWLASCATEEPPVAPEPAARTAYWSAAAADPCNPIAREWDCMLPFPSDWFRPRLGNAGPWQMRLPTVALPARAEGGEPIDMPADVSADGFSVGSQIAVRVPGSVGPAGLLAPYRADKTLKDKELGASIAKENATLILDADAGTFVPHISEVDGRADLLDDRVLLLRPLVPLAFAHRHVVVLRKGLQHADGRAIERPAGMQALIDAKAPAAEPLRALHTWYDQRIWPPLAKVGIARADVLLAWDFTTASQASVQADLLGIRALMAKALAAEPVVATVTSVETAPEPHVARRIHGELSVPAFVTDCKPGARLFRDSAGLVARNGSCPVPFVAIVPPSVATGTAKAPVRVLQYGHGFFGDRSEAQGAYGAELADKLGAVVVAVDWWGMSKPDLGKVVDDLLNRPWHALRFIERVHQAMANQLALTAAAKTTLAALPDLRSGGKPLFDPSHVYFVGHSQGHILGGVYVAIALDIDRAVLGVGGAGFGHMMARARPFADFRGMIDIMTQSHGATSKVQLLMVSAFDRIDPLAWSGGLRADAAGKVARPILLHTGLADAQVPNLCSHLHARALGAVHLQPAPRPVFGLATTPGPSLGHTLVEFDFGVEAPDALPQPGAKANGVHEGVRRAEAAIQQMDA
ncbi:MAG: hypothetical protein EXR79_10765, partial [Myxococcales bacterium]|nr:hypothetical protein [Myxococcales bacterium]